VTPAATAAIGLVLAVTAGLLLPAARIAPGLLLGVTLLALVLIDLRTMLLPDVLTLPLCGAGLALALAGVTLPAPDAVLGAGIGYATIAGIVHAYRRLRGRDGMGLGDAKLLAAGGAWVGWQALPLVLLVAALGTLAVVLLHTRGGAARDLAVPFGPGLAAGIWLAFVAAGPAG
jgi:leader peptidase (prepilin peptidase)/N-methyltransferase